MKLVGNPFGRKQTISGSAAPTLYLPDSILHQIQVEAMDKHGQSDAEILVLILCQRAWQDNGPAFWPRLTYVPRPNDYRLQSGESCDLKDSVWNKLFRKMVTDNYHPVIIHTHPPETEIGLSEGDNQYFQEMSLQLQRLPGQRRLITGVFDHFLSAASGVYNYWDRLEPRALTVQHPPILPPVTGVDYTEVGSLVGGFHRCPKSRWYAPALYQAQKIVPGHWKGTLVRSAPDLDKVWDTTPTDEVLIKINQWPPECGCPLQHVVHDIVSLADLGYRDKHPWRSG